jgi:predicted  nucleic acid-binding Zn-ribbon protein
MEPFMDEYVNMHTKMHFKCNKCGSIFYEEPRIVLLWTKCQTCKKIKHQEVTIKTIIEKANKIHNFKYDYSEAEYGGTDVKMKVICHEKDEFGDEHGPFWVTPHSHVGMMKSGCPKCSGKFRKDTEYFIRQARRIHGDEYDYSKTEYKNALSKVCIICPEHGEFGERT